jgi:hypothetical protein
MMTGTIQPAVEAAGPEKVQELMALMGAAYDRVMTDLGQALELRRQREARTGE